MGNMYHVITYCIINYNVFNDFRQMSCNTDNISGYMLITGDIDTYQHTHPCNWPQTWINAISFCRVSIKDKSSASHNILVKHVILGKMAEKAFLNRFHSSSTFRKQARLPKYPRGLVISNGGGATIYSKDKAFRGSFISAVTLRGRMRGQVSSLVTASQKLSGNDIV